MLDSKKQIDDELDKITKSLKLSETNQILVTATENYIITNVKLDAIIKTLAEIKASIENGNADDIEKEIKKDFRKNVDKQLNEDHIIRQIYPDGL